MHVRFSGKTPRGRAGSPSPPGRRSCSQVGRSPLGHFGSWSFLKGWPVGGISLVPRETWGPRNVGPIHGVARLRLGSGIWVDPGRQRGPQAEGAVSRLDRGPAVVCRPCRSGLGAACRLSRAESERRCRAPGQPPGGALCHGRGRCDCGVCICHVSEPGVYFGPLCECHEWMCETYDGSTCAGKGVALSPPLGPPRPLGRGRTRTRGERGGDGPSYSPGSYRRWGGLPFAPQFWNHVS